MNGRPGTRGLGPAVYGSQPEQPAEGATRLGGMVSRIMPRLSSWPSRDLLPESEERTSTVEIVHPTIEQYVTGLVPSRDPVLAAVEAAARAGRIPMVGPLEGQSLYLLARLARATSILEIGSATGYSAIWLARAAVEQGGTLVGIELDPARHEEAERNLGAAGLSEVARIIRGDAFAVLPTLENTFDFVFLDLVRQLGDESRLRRLFDLCMERVAVGGVLAVDNVLHGGEAVTGSTAGGRAAAMLNHLIATDRRLVATFLTIRDGLAVALKVRGEP